MKSDIKNLIREGLLLLENKLYPDKMINTIATKIGDSSDDTINKLAIAGLYRNAFGNIQQLKTKEQLDDVFKGWYDTTINNMVKTSAFIDNKELAIKYLDAYIKNIKSLGNKAQPFSLKKIEKGLVDLVNNNNWITDTSATQNNDIYNPKDEDKVYEDDDVIILDTNTKAKCVMYGRGESWCITKPELNYYNTYRIKYGATPYFVLQKNVEGNEHKVVIMHYKNGYAIADRSNSGNRAGGDANTDGPWSDIERELPNLKGLEKYFPYREITEEEVTYDEIIKKTKGYEGDNLQGYIDNAIKDLIINGSQVEAPDFIRDYAAEGGYISDGQIKSLRPEVINSLIESGYFLSIGSEQVNLLSSNQHLRVIRIKIQNNINLSYSDIRILPKNEGDEYLSKLSGGMIGDLLGSIPTENRPELINRIFPLVKDKLDSRMIGDLLGYTPRENRLELINRILPLVKGKLDSSNMLTALLDNIPKENRLELVNRIFPFIKDKLNGSMMNHLLRYTPDENRFELINRIFPFIKDELSKMDELNGYNIVGDLLSSIPKENRLELVNRIFPFIKDKLDGAMVESLLYYTPRENRFELINLILPFIKDKLDSMVGKLLSSTPTENRPELINLILQFIKDKLTSGIVSLLLDYTPKENRPELIKLIFPFIKDKLDRDMVGRLVSWTSRENRLDLVNRIFPFIKDKLDDDMVAILLTYVPEENKEYVKGLINNAKGVSESILRIKQLFK